MPSTAYTQDKLNGVQAMRLYMSVCNYTRRHPWYRFELHKFTYNKFEVFRHIFTTSFCFKEKFGWNVIVVEEDYGYWMDFLRCHDKKNISRIMTLNFTNNIRLLKWHIYNRNTIKINILKNSYCKKVINDRLNYICSSKMVKRVLRSV